MAVLYSWKPVSRIRFVQTADQHIFCGCRTPQHARQSFIVRYPEANRAETDTWRTA